MRKACDPRMPAAGDRGLNQSTMVQSQQGLSALGY